MTNEEMLVAFENATEDETVELLKSFAEGVDDSAEELNEADLEDVVGGVRYISTVGGLYNRYNKLSPEQKKKWKKKLNELVRNLLKFGKVAMPF